MREINDIEILEAPRPVPFNFATKEQNRRLARVESAVDDVVEAIAHLTDCTASARKANAVRLAAAARRLWVLATAIARG